MIPIRAYCASDQAKLISLWERCGLVRPWNVPADDIAAKLAYQPELLFVAPEEPETGEGDRQGIVGSLMAGYDGHRGWVNYLAVDPQLTPHTRTYPPRGIARFSQAVPQCGREVSAAADWLAERVEFELAVLLC